MEYYYNTIPDIDNFLHSFLSEIEGKTSDLSPIKGMWRKDCLTLSQGEFISLLHSVVIVCSFFGVETFDETIKSLTQDINELETALRTGSKEGVINYLKLLRVIFEMSTKDLTEKLNLIG